MCSYLAYKIHISFVWSNQKQRTYIRSLCDSSQTFVHVCIPYLDIFHDAPKSDGWWPVGVGRVLVSDILKTLSCAAWSYEQDELFSYITVDYIFVDINEIFIRRSKDRIVLDSSLINANPFKLPKLSQLDNRWSQCRFLTITHNTLNQRTVSCRHG